MSLKKRLFEITIIRANTDNDITEEEFLDYVFYVEEYGDCIDQAITKVIKEFKNENSLYPYWDEIKIKILKGTFIEKP